MWFHGGGWVWGNVVDYDSLCTLIAAEVGAVVVSVDYRMAPEHRAPRAALDCVDATTWVAANGDVLRADTSRMAVAGDSAGGNLAAVVAQVLRDHGMTNLRHQALIYPATDLTMASPSLVSNANAPVLDRAAVDAFRDHYLPPGADAKDPLVSPLWGDLAGLPPALVQTADRDPIRDDGSRYAPRRSRRPGCRCASPTTSGCRTASPRSPGRRGSGGCSGSSSSPSCPVRSRGR